MPALLQDLRYALRSLRQQPGFTAVALVTLALGIGANAAIFSVINTVLLKPLPYRDPGRVVMLWSHWRGWTKTWVSQPELEDYQHEARTLEHVGAFQFASFNLTGSGDALRVRAATVQASVFDALGVRPLVGRVFGPDEDRPGHEHVVLLGEALWRSQFAADPLVVGRSIALDGEPYSIVGVLPASLRLPNEYDERTATQLWVPIALAPVPHDQRGNHGLYAIGRLRPKVSLTEAQAEIDTVVNGFRAAYPENYGAEFGLTLVSAPTEVSGAVAPGLLLVLGAVGAVLLIACANVANLLLARSESRQKEIAIRQVLGAGRGRLVRQMLTEAWLLAGGGAALGLGLAWTLIRFLVTIDPLKIPRVRDLALDPPVLAFTALVACATGFIFGLMPALRASRADLQPVLKAGGRDSRTSTGTLRRWLVVAEIATSMALVVAALLLTRSFARLLNVDPGFNPAHVLTMRTSLPVASYADADAMVLAYRNLARELRGAPGIVAAGAVTGLPLATTRGDWGVRIEGRPMNRHNMEAADWQVITPGYFEAMGMPLRSGRVFTDADQAGTLPVVIVNESMARRFWPGDNPLGRRFAMGGNATFLTIVGVVADVHHRGLAELPRSEFYRPHTQFRFNATPPAAVPTMTWALRTSGDPLAAAVVAREAVKRVDRNLGLSEVGSMDQVVADATSDRRLNMVLFVLLGGLALALATVGVYGIVAYTVSERTHEIGVRLAVGASPAKVRWLMLGEGLRLAGAGILLGGALALGASQLMRGLLFNVSPTDPATVAGVAAALVVVAAVASDIPARRATRVDPVIALRGE